ncbi:MAG: signal peptide peptidase SppA [Candidatus Thermoplasmatota archaeon]|nr:signal peptide peptidase SppA [Candidatus Thermoplasmatota archaeon]
MFIAEIEFRGRITRQKAAEYLPGLDFVKRSRKARGLILTIDSGGGDANATEILYNKLMEISEIKPVYAYVEGMAASGAYWMACAAGKIYCMRTSLVGSIGVISMMPNVSGMLRKIGIDVSVMKVGEHKDMLSPFRAMDDEEKRRYQLLLNDIFETFRVEVGKRRKLSAEEMARAATGEVFTPSAAQEMKLIDGIMPYYQVVKDMAAVLKMKAKRKKIPPQRTFMQRLIGTEFIGGAIREAMDSVLDLQ